MGSFGNMDWIEISWFCHLCLRELSGECGLFNDFIYHTNRSNNSSTSFIFHRFSQHFSYRMFKGKASRVHSTTGYLSFCISIRNVLSFSLLIQVQKLFSLLTNRPLSQIYALIIRNFDSFIFHGNVQITHIPISCSSCSNFSPQILIW